MCWIAVLFQVNAHYPLIVAANREESRTRPSRAPFRWAGSPTVWAGRDELAGGTWLGVNATGLLAAVTNRPRAADSDSRDATRRSRGLLCLDTLRCDSPGSARAFFGDELSARRFNPFNLLCASPAAGWVGTWRGDVRDLAPGLHIVSNYGDVNDDTLPIVREARSRVASLDLATPDIDELLGNLASVCASTDQPFPLSRAGGDYGTVSSSLVAVKADGTVAAYWHAPGPPSKVGFDRVDLTGVIGSKGDRKNDTPTP
jgi:uncharacterized protein with NRDE domain